MRTTLDLDSDVLDVAKSLAEARHISVGKALSYLARRGATIQTQLSQRNGFSIFTVGGDAPQFGAEDVHAALEEDDRISGRGFLATER